MGGTAQISARISASPCERRLIESSLHSAPASFNKVRFRRSTSCASRPARLLFVPHQGPLDTVEFNLPVRRVAKPPNTYLNFPETSFEFLPILLIGILNISSGFEKALKDEVLIGGVLARDAHQRVLRRIYRRFRTADFPGRAIARTLHPGNELANGQSRSSGWPMAKRPICSSGRSSAFALARHLPDRGHLHPDWTWRPLLRVTSRAASLGSRCHCHRRCRR
ncbi:hypothetical protein AB7M17_004736 [Bradyrhizobium sp. USDA 377]